MKEISLNVSFYRKKKHIQQRQTILLCPYKPCFHGYSSWATSVSQKSLLLLASRRGSSKLERNGISPHLSSWSLSHSNCRDTSVSPRLAHCPRSYGCFFSSDLCHLWAFADFMVDKRCPRSACKRKRTPKCSAPCRQKPCFVFFRICLTLWLGFAQLQE